MADRGSAIRIWMTITVSGDSDPTVVQYATVSKMMLGRICSSYTFNDEMKNRKNRSACPEIEIRRPL